MIKKPHRHSQWIEVNHHHHHCYNSFEHSWRALNGMDLEEEKKEKILGFESTNRISIYFHIRH